MELISRNDWGTDDSQRNNARYRPVTPARVEARVNEFHHVPYDMRDAEPWREGQPLHGLGRTEQVMPAILYGESSLAYHRRPDGQIEIKQFYQQSASTFEKTFSNGPDGPIYDGPRHQGTLSPYSTFLSRGDTGVFALTLFGRLATIDRTGHIRTLFGPRHREGTLWGDDTEFVGNGFPLESPTDLIQLDDHTLLIADYGNRQIARFDLNARTMTKYLGPLPGGPVSLAYDKSKDLLWVSCMISRNIMIVEGASTHDSVMKTLSFPETMDRSWEPFCIRLLSDGTPVILDRLKHRLFKVVRPRLELIRKFDSDKEHGGWLWMTVDIKGLMGPKDDIFAVVYAGGNWDGLARNKPNTNTAVARIEPRPDGRYELAGRAHYAHYPWGIEIDAHHPRLWLSGGASGGGGLIGMRPSSPFDPPKKYEGKEGVDREERRGRRYWQNGGTNPDPAIPSLVCIYGWHCNWIGYENFDILSRMDPDDFAEKIRETHSHLTDFQMARIHYFVRLRSTLKEEIDIQLLPDESYSTDGHDPEGPPLDDPDDDDDTTTPPPPPPTPDPPTEPDRITITVSMSPRQRVFFNDHGVAGDDIGEVILRLALEAAEIRLLLGAMP